MKRLSRYMLVLYLLALIAVCVGVRFDNGNLWPVTLFLFSPRWLVAIPLVILVPLTVVVEWRLSLLYLLHGGVIVFLLQGFQFAGEQSQAASEQQTVLRVMTCNLGGGTIDTDKLVAMVASHDIDVVAFQECTWSVSLPVFQQLGWNHKQEANIAFGSPHPLGEIHVLARQTVSPYNPLAALCCEVRLSRQSAETRVDEQSAQEFVKIQVVNVHLPTFRPALAKARCLRSDTGAAIGVMGERYRTVAARTANRIRELAGPVVVMGDFNVPVESAFYRDYWSSLQNAFCEAGTGFGYTKHTRLHGVRIDHVLADETWQVCAASVEDGFGGDHRPVIAELAIRTSSGTLWKLADIRPLVKALESFTNVRLDSFRVSFLASQAYQ
jgi:endonuclease/exonuclease/phosphatase (EEP) superfamily protein YafD